MAPISQTPCFKNQRRSKRSRWVISPNQNKNKNNDNTTANDNADANANSKEDKNDASMSTHSSSSSPSPCDKENGKRQQNNVEVSTPSSPPRSHVIKDNNKKDNTTTTQNTENNYYRKTMEANRLYLQNAIQKAERDAFRQSRRSRPTRALINERAFGVAEALFRYERYIDTKANTILSSNNDGNEDGKIDIELDSSLIMRSREILGIWRKGIRTNDRISCADYTDEYEYSDANSTWVKLYDATVLSYTAIEGADITLGDSSKEKKEDYELKKSESAIFVKFDGFPNTDNQWLLLTGESSEFIVPYGSERKTIAALKNVHKIHEQMALEKTQENKKQSPGTPKLSVTSKTTTAASNIKSSAKKRKTSATPQSTKKRKDENISGLEFEDDAPLSAVQNKNKTKKAKITPSPKPPKIVAKKQPSAISKKQPQSKKKKASPGTRNRQRTKASIECNDDLIVEKETSNKIEEQAIINEQPSQTEEKKVSSLDKSNEMQKGAKEEKPTPKTGDYSISYEDSKCKLVSKSTAKVDDKESKAYETFTWICVACREAECAIDEDSPLIICDGPCQRPFHYPCAGLHSLPPEDQIWMCTDCIEKKHQCPACQQYGKDDVDVFKCDKKTCGLFFHEGCLSLYNVEVKIVTGDDGESRPRFRCPAHECWTCADGVPVDGNKTGKINDIRNFGCKKGELFRCLDCPNAFHISCIPPNARFHELALLCHEHAKTSKLPYLDFQYSIQAEVEADVDKKMLQMRKQQAAQDSRNSLHKNASRMSRNPFFPDYAPVCKKEKKTDKNHFFRLPNDFREVVHAKPSSYTHIHSLRYDPSSRPKRRPPNESGVCSCKPVPAGSDRIACGENCLNRLVMVECVGDSTSKTTNPYTNCNCGPTCGNRKVTRREVAKSRPKRENGKGWGLMAREDVKKGQFVQEYIGEVINEKTMIERLHAWSVDHPNDTNFYVMQLEPGWFIDAREKGNLSRFINHSCEPNCRLVPINVGGFMRVAVMSIRDIKAGEFFSYDYQFDTKHADRFVCRCGADKCRGTMKGGTYDANAVTPVKKSLAQRKDEGKARLERDRKFLEQTANDEIFRLNAVGMLVPGEPIDGSNTVASGPQEKDKDYVRNHHIFLWRNALVGADFNARYFRTIRKAKQKRNGKR